MSERPYALRIVVAAESVSADGANYSQIVFGFPETTWEIMPPEEWDALKRKLCAEWLGPDWTAYEFTEAILEVPQRTLDGLFSPSIQATVRPVDA